jgi:hypothetical protein
LTWIRCAQPACCLALYDSSLSLFLLTAILVAVFPIFPGWNLVGVLWTFAHFIPFSTLLTTTTSNDLFHAHRYHIEPSETHHHLQDKRFNTTINHLKACHQAFHSSRRPRRMVHSSEREISIDLLQ